jgi:WD40 repeat protein
VNEKLGIVAVGGSACNVGKLSSKPFISVHRVSNKANFPVLDT